MNCLAVSSLHVPAWFPLPRAGPAPGPWPLAPSWPLPRWLCSVVLPASHSSFLRGPACPGPCFRERQARKVCSARISLVCNVGRRWVRFTAASAGLATAQSHHQRAPETASWRQVAGRRRGYGPDRTGSLSSGSGWLRGLSGVTTCLGVPVLRGEGGAEGLLPETLFSQGFKWPQIPEAHLSGRTQTSGCPGARLAGELARG